MQDTNDSAAVTSISTVRLADCQSWLSGLRKMFIGYLLHASECDENSDNQVETAYYELEYDLENRIKFAKEGRPS
jgi:hypothetical protein